jgi:hypothetical protein
MLEFIEPREYMELLQDHKNKLEINKLEINKNILFQAFNSIEIKILEIEDYYNVPIECDDLLWFIESIKKTKQKKLIPYNNINLFNRIMNFSLCILPLKKILNNEIFNNDKNINNIIYVDFGNNTEPYSFYVLEKIENGKKFWKMDCRLENFVSDIIDNLDYFCCEMFRKYYENIFGDNNYRDNFLEKNTFTEIECNQLLENIILLSHKPKLHKLLINLVIKKSSYTPTNQDVFNLKKDDKIQRKNYMEMMEADWYDIIKKKIQFLFDSDCTEIFGKINL